MWLLAAFLCLVDHAFCYGDFNPSWWPNRQVWTYLNETLKLADNIRASDLPESTDYMDWHEIWVQMQEHPLGGGHRRFWYPIGLDWKLKRLCMQRPSEDNNANPDIPTTLYGRAPSWAPRSDCKELLCSPVVDLFLDREIMYTNTSAIWVEGMQAYLSHWAALASCSISTCGFQKMCMFEGTTCHRYPIDNEDPAIGLDYLFTWDCELNPEETLVPGRCTHTPEGLYAGSCFAPPVHYYGRPPFVTYCEDQYCRESLWSNNTVEGFYDCKANPLYETPSLTTRPIYTTPDFSTLTPPLFPEEKLRDGDGALDDDGLTREDDTPKDLPDCDGRLAPGISAALPMVTDDTILHDAHPVFLGTHETIGFEEMTKAQWVTSCYLFWGQPPIEKSRPTKHQDFDQCMYTCYTSIESCSYLLGMFYNGNAVSEPMYYAWSQQDECSLVAQPADCDPSVNRITYSDMCITNGWCAYQKASEAELTLKRMRRERRLRHLPLEHPDRQANQQPHQIWSETEKEELRRQWLSLSQEERDMEIGDMQKITLNHALQMALIMDKPEQAIKIATVLKHVPMDLYVQMSEELPDIHERRERLQQAIDYAHSVAHKEIAKYHKDRKQYKTKYLLTLQEEI